ncbi:MAG: AAA family ATPase [Candidatus Andersenbacteria bacterium]|nr:AAA family ATPase [Candidatus Andersenbacteria bacterium]
MKYTKFIIKKFKGINELELDLTKYPVGKIFPLVGLNESGKTTILEAINFFQEDLEDNKKHEILHKKDSGNFTGNVQVEAILELEETDKNIISEFLKKELLHLEEEATTITITKCYNFKNATFNVDFYLHNFAPEIKVKTSRQKIFKELEKENKEHKELFDNLIDKLKDRIPKILYFPDFLFDFPNKIYLENIETLTSEKEKEIQKEYKQIIDDILHTIKAEYSVNDFLTKIKALTDTAKQSAASQIKQDISAILNRKIVQPWQEIFPGPSKNILIEIEKDLIGHFLQIKVNEGTSPFLINERSLGFRWFFGFILFTEFRKARTGENGEYLFLFDEPASNLHESSQQKLLSLFDSLIDKSKIIYSTHSPYLINPKFILNCFIVKDEGRSTDDDYNFRQNIKAIPHKQFVANYPNEETHFKPILDVLEFSATDFDLTDNIVFFEGKFDYYTFNLIKNIFFHNEDFDFKLYPGASVDKYENIFREYLAHSKKFIAVFDADGDASRGGKGAKKRYIENISQELEKQVFTLKDIDENFDGFTTEKLFTETEKLDIQKKSHPKETIYNKGYFNSAILELFISEEVFELSEETKENFKKIFDFIKDKFSELEN